MYQLIDKFIQDAKDTDDNVFPFMATKIGNLVNQYTILDHIGMIQKLKNLSMLL